MVEASESRSIYDSLMYESEEKSSKNNLMSIGHYSSVKKYEEQRTWSWDITYVRNTNYLYKILICSTNCLRSSDISDYILNKI